MFLTAPVATSLSSGRLPTSPSAAAAVIVNGSGTLFEARLLFDSFCCSIFLITLLYLVPLLSHEIKSFLSLIEAEESARGGISGIENAAVGSLGHEGGRRTSFSSGRLLVHIGINKREAVVEPRILARVPHFQSSMPLLNYNYMYSCD
jgi:hypothetical protein